MTAWSTAMSKLSIHERARENIAVPYLDSSNMALCQEERDWAIRERYPAQSHYHMKIAQMPLQGGEFSLRLVIKMRRLTRD